MTTILMFGRYLQPRSVFEMQFQLIAVSIFFKACVKDHGDSSSRLLERGI